MARFVTGETFEATDTVTATKLNNAVNNAKISTDSVDGSTIELNSDALRLKDSGITTAKIDDSSSKTTGVTFAKMQHISTAKVLGRVSASEGDVEEAFDFKDEDDMQSNSATALASQQSIKKYVDDTSGLRTSSASAATGKLYVQNPFTAYDLDLSSVVGSNKAMVIINIDGGVPSTGSTQRYILRTKGGSVANDLSGGSIGKVQTGGSGTGGSAGTVIVVTDSSGVIEYLASPQSASPSAGANYTVVAFQVIS